MSWRTVMSTLWSVLLTLTGVLLYFVVLTDGKLW
jgi:hypothetical protein